MFPGSVISFNKEMRMSINSVVLYFVRRGMDKVAKLTVSRETVDFLPFSFVKGRMV